ncbi:MAG: phospholipase [Blastopirellula sp.]|nr:MAG: phospholipase [Blastopirellula sp.]
MKRFLFALFCLTVSLTLVGIISLRNRTLPAKVLPNEFITIDGTTRNYRIVLPDNLSKPAPLVIAFHGTGDSPESMAEYSQLDRLATQNGFILVYPAAQKSMWKTVNIAPEKLDENLDVRFFDALLSQLLASYEIDSTRVYVAGMSNGASFVQMLMTVRSNKIAAAVAHSGSRPSDLGEISKPCPTLLIVGENDIALSAIQADAELYRNADVPVQLIIVPNLGHQWSVPHNTEMWAFLSQCSTKD